MCVCLSALWADSKRVDSVHNQHRLFRVGIREHFGVGIIGIDPHAQFNETLCMGSDVLKTVKRRIVVV